MVKKVMMWTIYAGMVGLLVFGAVNRTSAKMSEGEAGGRNVSAGKDNSAGQGKGQDGNGRDQVEERSGTKEDSQVYGADHIWISLEGTIDAFSSEQMQVLITEGEIIDVSGQAWRLTLEQGFIPHVGDRLELNGFKEDGEFEVAEIYNISADQTVVLRDETGRPFWAGRNTQQQ